ncbi:MAG: tyrosine-type recombinase/integrase [Bryobacterales bacterium]|nr:tyrosine-type recombinase/integrase [Bryobacterales bacterium]
MFAKAAVKNPAGSIERCGKHSNSPTGFVLHSLRHTMLTRLGQAGVDAFTIMKIAGHSSITISQRYHAFASAMAKGIKRSGNDLL